MVGVIRFNSTPPSWDELEKWNPEYNNLIVELREGGSA